MLSKLKKSNNKGFTIIEVMIVLAIAGLIILIVLLAVPALQRNARNTAIKNDASAIAAAVSEYRSNNDGAQPNAGAQSGSEFTFGSGTTATAKVQSSTQVLFNSWAGANGSTPKAGYLHIFIGWKCSGGSWVQSQRSAMVIYSVETSNAEAMRCIDA